jgi:hypothetical protein
MDANNHEFLIKHARTGDMFISWIDTPLRAIQTPKRENHGLRMAK